MTTTPLRRRRISGLLFVVVFLALLIYSVVLTLRYAHQSLRLLLATDQTAFFDEQCDEARRGDPGLAAQGLKNVLGYYPSGTKQEAGTLLDVVVERARSHAVREIITILRAKTGGDLGDDPQAWIQEYLKKSNPQSPPATQL